MAHTCVYIFICVCVCICVHVISNVLFKAINTLIEKGILDSDHTEVAKFIHTSNRLRPSKKREFLELRLVFYCKLVVIGETRFN